MNTSPCPAPAYPPGQPAAPASLRLLGGFELLDASRAALPLPYEKVGVLLALLALHNGAWERGALAALLWPDSDSAQARANLRRALFDLREILARLLPDCLLEQLLRTDKRHIELQDHPALTVDTRQFDLALRQAAAGKTLGLQALQQAHRLYRGPLLPQLCLDQTPGVASWLQARREALHRQALQALDRLYVEWEQRGDLQAALEVARETLSHDPWNEPALQRCMRLLSGERRDEALRLYQEFAERLQLELGLQPQAQTMALADELRASPSHLEDSPAPAGLLRRRVVALAIEWRPRHAAQGLEQMEALATQLTQTLSQAASILRAEGAWVQRAESGELLAFFGHPEAQEHGVRRALDLALALLSCSPSLHALAGLDVGWIHALPGAASPDTLGDLSRAARRLCWQAQAGQAHVSAALQDLAAHSHRFSASHIAGASVLLAARPLPRRVTRPGPRELFGRDAELAWLQERWQAAHGQPQAVWIHAPAGLGKTQLIQAFLATRRQGANPPCVVRLGCLPEFSPHPLQAVLHPLQRTLGRMSPVRAARALHRLAHRRAITPAKLAPLAILAQTKPQSCQSRMDAATSAGSLHGREVATQLLSLLDAWVHQRPLLLVIEDLQWADPGTLELLSHYLLHRHPGAHAELLLLSAREPPPLSLVAQLTTLELLALTDGAMRQLALTLPPCNTQQLLASAQGVPLFARELARAWQHSPQQRVPARLWDLLAARLDRLPAHLRRLAQVAAALGSTWDADLLAAALGQEASVRLSLDLQRLQADGLLQRDPGGRWQFQYALQAEAAYESLTASERHDLHQRAADALLGPLADRVADDPAQLALHLSACNSPAADYYRQQADRIHGETALRP